MDNSSTTSYSLATDGMLSLSRRTFLHGSTLLMAGIAANHAEASSASTTQPASTTRPIDTKPILRIGLISDVHHADKEPKGNRYYRQSIAKVRESIRQFNKSGIDFAVELGDFIDAADSVEGEIGYLKAIEAEYAKLKADRYYVLGNHCVWNLTKQEFIANTAAKKTYHSFDKKGFHFVALDACFRKDGKPYGRHNFEWTDANIPKAQLDWLERNLGQTDRKTIVFVHHPLDMTGDYGLRNAEEVRRILEHSGKVLAVFQGHYHPGRYSYVNGIHYCTLQAVVAGAGKENNAYAILEVYRDGTLRLDGFRRQSDRTLRFPT